MFADNHRPQETDRETTAFGPRCGPYRPLIFCSIYSSTFRRTAGGRFGDERMRLMTTAEGPALLSRLSNTQAVLRHTPRAEASRQLYYAQRPITPRGSPRASKPVSLLPQTGSRPAAAGLRVPFSYCRPWLITLYLLTSVKVSWIILPLLTNCNIERNHLFRNWALWPERVFRYPLRNSGKLNSSVEGICKRN